MVDLIKTIPKISKGKSITEILPSIIKLSALELDDQRSTFGSEIFSKLEKKFKGVKKVIVFQIDGLGYDRISRLRNRLPFDQDYIFKIYTTFPTYTLPVFASFNTGSYPSLHGMIAGTFKIDGQIKWIGDMKDGESLDFKDSLFWKLEKGGRKCYSVHYDQHNDASCKKIYPHSFFIPSVVSGEKLTDEARIVEDRVLEKVSQLAGDNFYLMTAYFYYLDALTGRYGKFSKEAINHCLYLIKEIIKVSKKFSKQSLFMIMGDHGHTSLKKNVILDHDVMQNIFSQTGSEMALDGRMVMFYSGNLKLTQKLFEEKYGKYVEEVAKKDYLCLLGGTCNPEIEKRIGDLIYTAQPHYTLRTKPKKSKATHGGISRQEFETVLICWKN